MSRTQTHHRSILKSYVRHSCCCRDCFVAGGGETVWICVCVCLCACNGGGVVHLDQSCLCCHSIKCVLGEADCLFIFIFSSVLWGKTCFETELAHHHMLVLYVTHILMSECSEGFSGFISKVKITTIPLFQFSEAFHFETFSQPTTTSYCKYCKYCIPDSTKSVIQISENLSRFHGLKHSLPFTVRSTLHIFQKLWPKNGITKIQVQPHKVGMKK